MSSLCLFMHPGLNNYFHKMIPSCQKSCLFDFLIIVLPQILFLSEYYVYGLYLFVFFCVTYCFNYLFQNGEELCVYETNSVHLVTKFRSTLLILTMISILAIDFVVYPRRFGKCETFGFSVMDIGVGAFIFGSGLISPQARGKKNIKASFISAFRSTLPLLILGFVRLISHRELNYQLHVSEYGLHWNFFFTMGVVTFLSIFLIYIPTQYYLLLGCSLALGYQYALTYLNLEDYILNAPRVTVISMNKEGICSCIGFMSIYLISISIGRRIFQRSITQIELGTYFIGSLIFTLSLHDI
eukprot:UN34498